MADQDETLTGGTGGADDGSGDAAGQVQGQGAGVATLAAGGDDDAGTRQAYNEATKPDFSAGADAVPQTPEQQQAADAKAKAAAAPTAQPQQPPAQGQAMTPQQVQQYAVKLQTKEAELTTRQQELMQFHQQVSAWWANPLVQQTFRQVQAIAQGQTPPTQQGTQSPQQAQPTQQGTIQALLERVKAFQPETENEKIIPVLADVIRQMHEQNQQFGQRFNQYGSTIERYERQAQAAADAQTDQVIVGALDKIKADYPDLVDNGPKSSALMAKAANIVYADTQMRKMHGHGTPITADQALAEAAWVLAKESIQAKARAAVEGRARRAAAAQVETPAADSAQETADGSDDAARAAYRQAMSQ